MKGRPRRGPVSFMTNDAMDPAALIERRGLRLLLVEDDEIDQMSFRRTVSKEGLRYEIISATSVAEAAAELGKRTFDVIVTDYSLGDGSAFDVSARAPGVPWIIVTGAGDETVAVAALRAGAEDYIVKRTDGSHLRLLPFAIDAAVRTARAGEGVRMLSYAVKSVLDAVYITDLAGNFLFANAAFTRLYGYAQEALLGLKSDILDADGPRLPVHVWDTMKAGWVGEVVHKARGGTRMPIWLTRSCVENDHGQISAMVHVARDMTERRRLEDALRRTNEKLSAANQELERSRAALEDLAIKDELTGLYNRRELNRLLSDEVARSARTGHPLSLILLDLDRFKQVNDEHGHVAGDEVLKGVARLLGRALRRIDRAARFGGEELAILLPETPASEAVKVAERIRQQLAVTSFLITNPQGGEKPLFATASLGVAALDDTVRTPEDLIRVADQELYRAKAEGRNRTCGGEVASRSRTPARAVRVRSSDPS